MRMKGRDRKVADADETKEEDVSTISSKPATPKPVELMRLPLEERRRILAKAAAEAEDDYLNDPELTDCEAFGDVDLYDETP